MTTTDKYTQTTTAQEFYEALQANIETPKFWVVLLLTVGGLVMATLFLAQLFEMETPNQDGYLLHRTVIFLFLTTLTVCIFAYLTSSPIREARLETVIELTENYENVVEILQKTQTAYEQTAADLEQTQVFVNQAVDLLEQNKTSYLNLKTEYEQKLKVLAVVQTELEQMKRGEEQETNRLRTKVGELETKINQFQTVVSSKQTELNQLKPLEQFKKLAAYGFTMADVEKWQSFIQAIKRKEPETILFEEVKNENSI